ncbi:MAG: transglycosylase domain-containing protein [Coriobacteriia bacterium]
MLKPALGVVGGLFAVLLAGIMISGLAGVSIISGWLKDLPDYQSTDAFQLTQPTRIYSADGVLLAKLYLENREIVPMSQIATSLADAVVAVEDERFYKHKGVDPAGIVRAFISNANSSGQQGGSTITQQLVRNTVLIDEKNEDTLRRKVREAFIALEMEKRFSKKEILAMYMNTIYFGEGAYGAEAASQTYFNKSAMDLTLPEAATIAGLAQRPSALNPYDNPDGATQRRNKVLSRMLVNGYITQAEYDAAVATPLVCQKNTAPQDGIYATPYFVAAVQKQLSKQFPQSVIFSGGLTVTTTIDTRLQGYAEAAAHATLNKPTDPEVALVSIDPRNGYVKALVGGRDYSQSKFNLATQAYRQAGSSFKMFTLVTALDQGMPPNYEIDSSDPAIIPTKPKKWTVNNSEGTGHGLMTLSRATALSVNTVYARLGWAIGINNIINTAHEMGITSTLPEYASIVLGTAGVTPLEMASAYGTLATNGVHYDPVMITNVTDRDGKVIYEAKSEGKQVISPEVAHAATEILTGVIKSGTATRANIGRPAAGKTGTSQLNRDAWFVGYTPQLVTSVWIGYPTERTVIVRGSRAYGGTVAAPIWAAYMKQALADQPVMAFLDADTPHYNASKFDIAIAEVSITEDMKEYTYSDLPAGTIISQTTVNGRPHFIISLGPQPSQPTTSTGGGGSGDTSGTP